MENTNQNPIFIENNDIFIELKEFSPTWENLLRKYGQEIPFEVFQKFYKEETEEKQKELVRILSITTQTQNQLNELQQEVEEGKWTSQEWDKAETLSDQTPEKQRAGWMTPLYLLIRSVGLWYIPATHNKNFWNKGFLKNIFQGWSFTKEGGFWQKQIADRNREVFEYFKNFDSWVDILQDEKKLFQGLKKELQIPWLRDQVKEKASQVGKSIIHSSNSYEFREYFEKLSTKDALWHIDKRIQILESLENAINSWDTGKINKFQKQYTDICEETMNRIRARASMLNGWNDPEKARGKAISDEIQRTQDLEWVKKRSELWQQKWKLKVGDQIRIQWEHNNRDFIDFEIKSINGDEIEITGKTFSAQNGENTFTRKKIKIDDDWILKKLDGTDFYKWTDVKVKSRSLIGVDSRKLANTPDVNEVKERRSEYEKVKEKVEHIDTETKKARKEIQRKLKALEKNKNPNLPAKQAEAKKIVAAYETHIQKLEVEWAEWVTRLKGVDIDALAKTSPFVDRLKKANKFLIDKVDNTRPWKIVIGFTVFTLAFASAEWLGGVLQQGLSKENLVDGADMVIWLIPWLSAVAWVNDLYICFNGKDWNGRSLTAQERAWRGAFWVAWFIPWVWFLLKWWAKIIGKGGRIAQKSVKTADIMIEGAQLTWKVATYTALGMTLYHSTSLVWHNFNSPEKTQKPRASWSY